jgi:hypothetical protein
MRFGARGLFSVEVDNTNQYLDDGVRYTNWLERFSFGLQTSAVQSFAIGIRRIVGAPAIVTPGVSPASDDWNLSAAFHRRLPFAELYIAYGDASTVSTSPQFIIKFIRYVGADKGT